MTGHLAECWCACGVASQGVGIRFRVLAGVVAAGGLTASVLLVPGMVSAAPPVEIGKQGNTCVLKAQAICKGVVAKRTGEHHGNLKKANLSDAKLSSAECGVRNRTTRTSPMRT